MPYDDPMLQAREQYSQQAAPAPAQGQPTAPAQPTVRTNPLAQANTDAPTGWLGAVDARLDRRFPLISALAGNDKTVADVNARTAELKDERTAKTFASFGRGIQSQLSRAYADRLSDAQMKALHGSKAVEDMAIVQTIMQMAPDIMREVADEQTWHLFDSNDRHPNLDAAQRLLFNYGYRFGMDDKSNIYVESLDGKTQFLLDDNGIRTLMDAAQANLRNTVDLLASQDPKNASCLPQGQALMAIQKRYTEAGAGLEEASKMANAAYKAVMGTSTGNRFEALSSFDSLKSGHGDNLEQILASGPDGMPMLGNNGAILVAQMQRNLARDGVEVVPNGNGGLNFIINNRAYGIENGVYNMGQFYDRLKQAEEADPNSVSNVTKRSSEEFKAAKATQELAKKFQAKQWQAQIDKWARDAEKFAQKFGTGGKNQGQNQDDSDPSRPLSREDMYKIVDAFGDSLATASDKDLVAIRKQMALIDGMSDRIGIDGEALNSMDFKDNGNLKKLIELDKRTRPFYQNIKDIYKKIGGDEKTFRNPVHEKLMSVLKNRGDEYERKITKEEVEANKAARRKGDEDRAKRRANKINEQARRNALLFGDEYPSMPEMQESEEKRLYDSIRNKRLHDAEDIRRGRNLEALLGL